jgi:hypothetical protein
MNKTIFFSLLSFGIILSACGQPGGATSPTSTPVLPTTQVPPTFTSVPATPTLTATPAPTNTLTPEPPTATASPIPTYAILRGTVNVDKVSCRYGPGAPYLYLYGMIKGAVQDVIGRTDTGTWVLTKSRGDNKACWVKTEYLDLNGDVMSVEMVYPDKYKVPASNQTYRSPWDVVAIRKGDQVEITWKSDPRHPGDEESPNSVLYVAEVWTCQNGKVTFTPMGTYQPVVTVKDEAGCTEPSHGRIYFSEKHGYAGPTEIIWPPAQ